jgi:hypothetical protein
LADFHFFSRFSTPALHTRVPIKPFIGTGAVHHLARAMVLLDASAIARNVGRDLVFPASRRASSSHSDFHSCKPRILRFHTGPVPHEILGSKTRRTMGLISFFF